MPQFAAVCDLNRELHEQMTTRPPAICRCQFATKIVGGKTLHQLHNERPCELFNSRNPLSAVLEDHRGASSSLRCRVLGKAYAHGRRRKS